MKDRVGIYKHGQGWRAVVSRGRNRSPLTRHFPDGTPFKTMQDWRADERAKLRLKRKGRAAYGTLAGDVARYLVLVKGLPTFSDRKRELGVWVSLFGARQRDSLTSAEIRAVRDTWRATPRSDTDKRPLAAATINRRLRALSNLYTVLDGRHGENPVRDVEELREPGPRPRAIPYETIAKLIEALPDRARPVKGEKVGTVSATKIRIRCLAYSQITPKQLGEIQPTDLDLEHGRIQLPARRKGRGADAVWVPLLPDAVLAFRDFDKVGLYGPFSQHALRHSWKRAAKRIGLVGSRPYDARHTFGALVYRATQSREAVQQLLQHADWSTSARYAMSAEDEVRLAHGATVIRHFGTSLGTTSTGTKRKEAENSGQIETASDAVGHENNAPEASLEPDKR